MGISLESTFFIFVEIFREKNLKNDFEAKIFRPRVEIAN